MKKFDFIPDRAIICSAEDELNRNSFAEQLKASLSTWENEESLVISLKGEWGEGKSSVINLLKEQFELTKGQNDPTIIEFNPWAYANQDSLSFHFFNDISSELNLKKDAKKDDKLAKKLKLYSQLINLDNESKALKDIIPHLILLLGILGVSANKIFDWIPISSKWVENSLFFMGLLVLLAQLFGGVLNKIASYLEFKSITSETSPQGLKREIVNQLIKRKKKLLIVIDDIDRLSQKEICEVFKLIRVNADFPNTIYLLAFDSRIIEANLEEQKGITGKDYLKKIVQVDFNLPYTRNDKIQQFLFKELDKLIHKLPNSINEYFKTENHYWANTYHAGYKNFFKNIRDVKRYINSLLFNINLLHREEIFEINPIDFIALEALRVFTPDFYDFMKFRKDLFTDPSEKNNQRRIPNEQRKNEILTAISKVEEGLQDSVKKLVNNLFPQLDSIIKETGGVHYVNDFYAIWRKNMRICSKEHFDLYFTLNPDDNAGELTQYELEKFIRILKDNDETEKLLQEYIANKKFRPLLRKIQDFTENREKIPENSAKNLIKGLNNLSDNLEDEKEGMFDLGLKIELVRVIYQLLSKEDKTYNYKTIKSIADESEGIFGILDLISLQTHVYEKNPADEKLLFTNENLVELQKIIIEKVENTNIDKLLANNYLLHIVNKWKEWGSEEKLNDFITKIKNDRRLFLNFLKHFITVSRSMYVGAYGVSIHKQIGFRNLERFLTLKEADNLMENIIKESPEFQDFSELIEMYYRDHELYTKNPDKYSNFDFD
ncbi:MAG TPA: hypothetical protein DIW31_02910 [Bacteroidales bacterium]|nr:hypothetical protein [Bacteroidales bacterium]